MFLLHETYANINIHMYVIITILLLILINNNINKFDSFNYCF